MALILQNASHNIEVLKSILDEYRKDARKGKDLNLVILPDDKATEAKWNTQEDTSGFIVKMDNKPATQRGLQAALSHV